MINLNFIIYCNGQFLLDDNHNVFSGPSRKHESVAKTYKRLLGSVFTLDPTFFSRSKPILVEDVVPPQVYYTVRLNRQEEVSPKLKWVASSQINNQETVGVLREYFQASF
jgi:hypothetical protein